MEPLELRVQLLLDAIAKDEGFVQPTFVESQGSKKGDNFIGVIHRVTIQENHIGGQKNYISVIVKTQPKNEALCVEFGIEDFFSLECEFYNTILPLFINFQKEKGITADLLAPSAPKCYHASSTAIILEDMLPYGYLMCDRQEEFDVAHCAAVLRELGRFHAVSIALRDQKPELYQSITKDLKETFLKSERNPNMVVMYDNAVKKALVMFKERAVVEDKQRYVEKYEKFAADFYKTLMELVNPKNPESIPVLNHGDCWNMNILYKYGKDGKLPTGVCLLDFQLLRHASPATDVSYFLFCCTSKAVRDAHYVNLLEEYYHQLSNHITLLGSDPDKLFPREALDDQLKKFGKYGLGLAVFEIPLFTSDGNSSEQDSAGDTKSDLEKNFNISHSNDEVCWNRISNCIIDSVDKGYIL